jgi:hypothetical protein
LQRCKSNGVAVRNVVALLLLLSDDVATCSVMTLLFNDGVATRNATALLLRWCYLAMALQLATLQHCYYDAIVALLVNDGVTALLLLRHYCSVMALQRCCCCGVVAQ